MPPKQGHGRFRNTAKAQPYPLSPQDVSAFGQQRTALFYQHNLARASLKHQAQLIRSQFRMNRGDIREERRAGVREVGGQAEERGILGSTVHEAGRQEVIGAAESALARARMERNLGLSEVFSGRLQALSGLRMGLAELAMNRAATQRQMSLYGFSTGRAPY